MDELRPRSKNEKQFTGTTGESEERDDQRDFTTRYGLCRDGLRTAFGAVQLPAAGTGRT